MKERKFVRLLAVLTAVICFTSLGDTHTSQAKRVGPPVEKDRTDTLPRKIGGIPFQTFLNSKSYLLILKTKAMRHERSFGSCSAPVYEGRIATGRPHVPRALPDQEQAPQWIEILKIGGCNAPHELQMLIALIDGAPRFYPMLPGDGLSLLDFTVTEDVKQTLINFEQPYATSAGCKKGDTIRFHDIRLLSYRRQNDSILWDEAWEVSNCKARKTLTINFTTNPEEGTAFTINQPEEEADTLAEHNDAPDLSATR